jgi:hypothetical protein
VEIIPIPFNKIREMRQKEVDRLKNETVDKKIQNDVKKIEPKKNKSKGAKK